MGNLNRNLIDDAALPAILALMMAGAMIAALLFWSANGTDSVSFERQQQLVAHVLERSTARMAQEQETIALYDPLVTIFRRSGWYAKTIPAKLLEAGDGNVGYYFHDSFGHDEAYVLDGAGRPLYSSRNGIRIRPGDYQTIAGVADPVVAGLRVRTRLLHPGPIRKNSPSAFDIAVVHGHPAIIAVKPIMSHTGKAEFRQPPGREIMLINIRRLDGDFIQDLANNYLFRGARFARSNGLQGHEASIPFISPRTHRPIGYFIWQPYRPGSIVLVAMILPLLAGLLVVWLVTQFLIGKVRRGTAQLQASEAQARHLAFHDVLTGLPNRALFGERVEKALAAVRAGGKAQAALLFIDLDRFKWVNDTLGHPAGDELIREVARRLTAVIRTSDTAARLGGDEFAIIQSSVRSKRDIESLCRRIQNALKAPFDLIGSQAHIGVSIGVARAPFDTLDRSELARKADIALYHAKAAGRGCAIIFDKKMDTTIQYRKRIERDLRQALAAGDQLEVFYQPQFDSASMKLVGVEALVRWNHPEMGLLYPSTFIPIAEETGLIEQLGEWVFKEAFAAGRRWKALVVSVNASAVQLRNPLFAQRVMKIAADARFNLARLELEITETSLLENLAQCQANLLVLRAHGVSIALDDFGTGYSSLSHLRAFRVDRVKIDRSFIMGLGDPTGRAIVKAIVDLAQSSDLQITAEGVETLDQSNYLRAAGCHELQGFGLSMPLQLEDFEDTYILGDEPQQGLRAAA